MKGFPFSATDRFCACFQSVKQSVIRMPDRLLLCTVRRILSASCTCSSHINLCLRNGPLQWKASCYPRDLWCRTCRLDAISYDGIDHMGRSGGDGPSEIDGGLTSVAYTRAVAIETKAYHIWSIRCIASADALP